MLSFSTGIIGGADGPTAIFISDPYNLTLIFAAAAALVIGGIVFFIVKKQKKK